MTSIYGTNDGLSLQCLSEGDFLGDLSDHDHVTSDETPIGVDRTWLCIGAGDKVGSGIDLFPDLLNLDPDEDISQWMEEADVKQLLLLAEDVSSDAKGMIHFTHDPPLSCNLDKLTPEVHVEQLTPPESPHVQVASDIYFNHKDMDTIMASPLSPIDISLILDTPLSESVLSTTQPSNAADIHQHMELQPVSIQPVPIQPTQTMETVVALTIQDIESFVASTSYIPTTTELTVKPSTPNSYCDLASPEGGDRSDPDYHPSCSQPLKIKSKPRPRKRAAINPNSSESGSDIADSFDVLTRITNKKERKKVQNKNAATRYREKKREEKSVLRSEEDVLQDHNDELHDKVEQLMREIGYMKDLMSEMSKARSKALSHGQGTSTLLAAQLLIVK